MSTPYARVMDVALERNDQFPTITGFGTPLFITGTPSDLNTNVSAANLVRSYASLPEVALDFSAASEAYKMVQAAKQQQKNPLTIKIGYVDATSAATILAGLDALFAYDSAFYVMVPDHHPGWTDAAATDTLIAWAESKSVQLFIDSFDADTENPALTSSVAGRNKGQYERTAVFYNDVTTEYLSACAAAYLCTRNLDNAGNHFTMKWKGGFSGVTAIDKPSAAIQAITGFVPSTGLDETQGHFANTYIKIGGRSFIVEGTNLKGGFIDEIFASDWLVTRTQEEVLGVYLNNAVIEASDVGVDSLVQAVQRVMGRAKTAGILGLIEDADGNDTSWVIRVGKVAAQSAAQRRQRIPPAIEITFKYAGALHYTTIKYTMTY